MPFVLWSLTMLVGRREGIWSVKTECPRVGCTMTWLELCTSCYAGRHCCLHPLSLQQNPRCVDILVPALLLLLSVLWHCWLGERKTMLWQLSYWGTGIRGLMRGMATLSQGNQELFVVRDKSWKTPRWAWGKQVHGMWYFLSSALTLLVGRQEGHPACKNWMLICWWWLELCTTYSSSSPVVTITFIILCFNKQRLSQVHLENGR